MLHLVVDNSKLFRSGLWNYFFSKGLLTFSIENGLKALRDLAIDLKLNGASDAEALEEMRKSLRYVASITAVAGVDPILLTKIGEQDIRHFLDLAQPLKARPAMPADKPEPPADPAEGDIIDVEFEEVTDAFDLRDDDTSAILYARAA